MCRHLQVSPSQVVGKTPELLPAVEFRGLAVFKDLVMPFGGRIDMNRSVKYNKEISDFLQIAQKVGHSEMKPVYEVLARIPTLVKIFPTSSYDKMQGYFDAIQDFTDHKFEVAILYSLSGSGAGNAYLYTDHEKVMDFLKKEFPNAVISEVLGE